MRHLDRVGHRGCWKLAASRTVRQRRARRCCKPRIDRPLRWRRVVNHGRLRRCGGSWRSGCRRTVAVPGPRVRLRSNLTGRWALRERWWAGGRQHRWPCAPRFRRWAWHDRQRRRRPGRRGCRYNRRRLNRRGDRTGRCAIIRRLIALRPAWPRPPSGFGDRSLVEARLQPSRFHACAGDRENVFGIGDDRLAAGGHLDGRVVRRGAHAARHRCGVVARDSGGARLDTACHRCAAGRSAHLLKRANGLLEGQPLRLEERSRHAATLTDDRRQYDGPVDARTASLLGRERRVFQDLRQARRYPRFGGTVSRWAVIGRTDGAGHVVAQALQVDATGLQYDRCIVVLRQGQQQMLEGDLGVRLMARVVARTHERRLKRRRHRDSAPIIGHGLHHSSSYPHVGDCRPIPWAGQGFAQRSHITHSRRNCSTRSSGVCPARLLSTVSDAPKTEHIQTSTSEFRISISVAPTRLA